MRDVYVSEDSYGGITLYTVMVDGKPYDHMHLRRGPRLTFQDQHDMASYYREALDED